MSDINGNQNLSPYGADCPISMPEPIDADPGDKAAMGGFAFIHTGLVHDLTATERTELNEAKFAPYGGLDGR